MADIATIEVRLVEAEEARHKLMLGTRSAEVSYSDGSRVRFTEATLAQLEAYIKTLQQELAQARGFSRRPITFEFGR